MDQWLVLLSVSLATGALNGLVGTGCQPSSPAGYGAHVRRVRRDRDYGGGGFLANFSRALAWWRSSAWRAVLAYPDAAEILRRMLSQA
ncbi:hypothetical protein F4V91_30950 [Neorhizobium galegae]|uniref:Uncharacterized protein n=1 Tax=Neorhizobium galegae TaxID=399 RepID=A0A6A1TPH8_NEOGA|nr:hypothetical protein [Neorhizobium galegae]KAB1083849.1 hypothetical protein F4V91_30950 [Neorhizobium galegae]